MKYIVAIIALATAANAVGCWPSIACHNGGDDTCNRVCIRQGNPKGGRCLPRDGCPGSNICACFPRKRSAGAIDGDEALINDPNLYAEVFGSDAKPPEKRSEEPVNEVVSRDAAHAAVADIVSRDVDARSLCCSLLPPAKGLCCDQHCTHIQFPGGQCSDKDICVCNPRP
ncbi:arthropod defensin domain-containing protein [Pochonia chlamydosporia 170]|uniref:Arthropod defensin domain-containing protein n=1 Tax=Pochonia chlamydosporia 170 TaxID=1380566 RepID=A0A179F5H1_METCM|nr:arthropod defensin domain-containing protein [Pochonia chlamydosporia 170]OAQ60676.1 arthropod defensin domain-containing protein [Pochonia chlamydosporia 170]